jgi:hypothetical protein
VTREDGGERQGERTVEERGREPAAEAEELHAPRVQPLQLLERDLVVRDAREGASARGRRRRGGHLKPWGRPLGSVNRKHLWWVIDTLGVCMVNLYEDHHQELMMNTTTPRHHVAKNYIESVYMGPTGGGGS